MWFVIGLVAALVFLIGGAAGGAYLQKKTGFPFK